MAVRLQRKARRNKVKAAQRTATIKKLLFIPVIKTVSVEEIKKTFNQDQ